MEFDSSKSDDGYYEIYLTHTNLQYKNVFFSYSFSINSSDVWRIIPDYAYITYLDDKSTYERYEIYITQPQQVYVELFECFGKDKLQASTSYDNLEKGVFD